MKRKRLPTAKILREFKDGVCIAALAREYFDTDDSPKALQLIGERQIEAVLRRALIRQSKKAKR